MPDLVILWDVEARVTTELVAEGIGVVRGLGASCQVAPFYTGNHEPRAFAIAAGPGIAANAVHSGASALDLAPTILRHFGLDVPSHMPGSLLSGWVHPSGPAANTPAGNLGRAARPGS
jgi:hypothetical protein